MAKIQRKTQKIFAGNATSDQITAFGTAKDISPTYTKDLNAIQTDIYAQGWAQSLLSDLAPYLQDSNALWFLVTSQLAYLFQQGISEWDSATEYTQGSLVSKYNNGNLEIYMSLQNSNTNHDLNSTSWWKKYTFENIQSSTTAVTHTANTAVGSATVPVYVNSSGVATAITSYSGNSATATKATNVNNSRTNGSLKVWTGTTAQYNAITSKDANTLYNITDDQDVTLSILQTIYPVGSLFMTTNTTCPLSALFGTWTKVASGVVTSVTSNAPVEGNGMAIGLTDNSHYGGMIMGDGNSYYVNTKAYGLNSGSSVSGSGGFTTFRAIGITTDSSKSGMVATVSSSSYPCNLFRRTA